MARTPPRSAPREGRPSTTTLVRKSAPASARSALGARSGRGSGARPMPGHRGQSPLPSTIAVTMSRAKPRLPMPAKRAAVIGEYPNGVSSCHAPWRAASTTSRSHVAATTARGATRRCRPSSTWTRRRHRQRRNDECHRVARDPEPVVAERPGEERERGEHQQRQHPDVQCRPRALPPEGQHGGPVDDEMQEQEGHAHRHHGPLPEARPRVLPGSARPGRPGIPPTR